MLFPAKVTKPPKNKNGAEQANSADAAADAEGRAVGAALATHALVFQITGIGRDGKRIQRVVGVHPVSTCTALLLDELFWETVSHLYDRAGISVAAAVCDGAVTNRLFIKHNTSEPGESTPDVFITSSCDNLIQIDRKLFFISDSATAIRRPATTATRASAT